MTEVRTCTWIKKLHNTLQTWMILFDPGNVKFDRECDIDDVVL